jgi:glycosyltransferase involved in cell wall biosynthesis/peptidoglycan/xylan/chitin deacetylase (PgdA/CDA1 family)
VLRDTPPLWVTTSWDDGHVLDMRLATMLRDRALAGTFYVSPRSVELQPADRLSPSAIRDLAQDFEIGGHTLTHRRLTTLDRATSADEIRGGKDELEAIIGSELRSFCYPGGEFNAGHTRQVRQAGFAVGRTVRRYVTAPPTDLMQVDTTVHAYQHLKDVTPILRHARWRPKTALSRYCDWAEMAMALFDETALRGGVFHLWGHSWEIDARSDWAQLERLLDHIAGRPGARYITNGDLADSPPDATPRPIVQVVPYFPPHIGGVENVAKTIAEGLAQGGLVEVLTSTSHAGSAPAVERHGNLVIRRLASVDVEELPLMPTLLLHLLRLPRRAVVHVHVAQALVPDLVRLAAFLRRRPYVAHFHLDVEPSGRFGFLFVAYKRLMLGGALRSAARLIVLSPDQADFVERRYRVERDRIVVLPNGVGQDFFTGPRQPPSHEGPFRLLSVGRLSPQKNMTRLLRAMAAVTEPVELVIVGDGDERPQLEQLSAELGLVNVRMIGTRFGADLHEWYHWADAFVLASDKEGMPLVLLEAMAGALPIVATDVPGIADTVRDDGLLARPDPQSLAKAIDRLASDPALWAELSRRGQARAEEYAWDTLVDSLRVIYDQVGT